MNKYGIIYKITNTVNGKSYIGQCTCTLTKRWKMHRTASRLNRSSSVFHNSINKYGYQNFKVEEILSCFSKEELDKMEDFYIKQYDTLTPNGYNIKEGGANGKWSKHRTDQLSKELKEKFSDEDQKQQFIQQMQDGWNNLSEEEKLEKMEIIKSGSDWYWTKEQRIKKAEEIKQNWENLPDPAKAKRVNPMREYWTEDKLKEHSERMKEMEVWKKSGCLDKAKEKTSKKVKVICLATKKETIYDSQSDCVRALKMAQNTIIDILKGRRSNEYKGFRFENV